MKKQSVQYVTTAESPLSYLSSLAKHNRFSEMVAYLFEDNLLRWFYLSCSYLAHKLFLKHYSFNHQRYTYANQSYNRTWGCERSVEIPLALKFIKPATHGLEVGAVLRHYHKTHWTIVDKFEQAPGVINHDILNFNPPQLFDRIVSISTLEHVGIDDTNKNPRLGVAAIRHLITLLKPQGKLFISIPVGYNPILDHQFITPGLFTTVSALKRTSPWNSWKQVDPHSIVNSHYGWPYNNANAILIGQYTQTLNA